MRAFPRTITFVLLAVVLATAAYVFRSQLADAPIVSTIIDRLGWRAGMALEEGRAMSADMEMTVSMPATSESSVGMSPRAEINIDLRRQQLLGVRTAPAERRMLTQSIRAVGSVRYDETRLADINVKVDGWVEELHVDYTGQFIEPGQPLFTLYSPELLTTQREYLLAMDTRDQLRNSQIAEARDHADRLVEATRQRLALWDLPPDEIEALKDRGEAHRTMLFRTPVGGFIIEKQVVQGQHVTAGMSLYTVADLSVVWVEADIYEHELSLVREGMPASVTVDAYPEDAFRGRIIYIYPYVEERTRTVRVRVELSNPRGRLKPGMYANVGLDATIGEGVVVPANALLDSGTEQYVFLSQGEGYFEPRAVVVGSRLGEAVHILEGLDGTEMVATNATFFLDSESQLRAALQGFDSVPVATGGGAMRERLDIRFRSQPDPPQSGANVFEVTVADADGGPVIDADVSVIFYMAPMPTMSMPAMQTDAELSHQGGGVYGGNGEVMMAGRWDVTVVVSREGQPLDSRVLTVVAR